jgi:putative GTP pyrophosphokinase
MTRFDSSEVTRGYNAVLANAKRLEQEALYILDAALKETDVKVDNVEHRVKPLDSVLRKCESRTASFDDVSDVVGLRVIVLLRSDLERVEQIVRANFDVSNVDKKSQESPDSFGYMSVHCDCRLKSSYSGRRYDGLHGLTFEVQLRTICMHAWAAVSHHLEYKQQLDIPLELRKELNALSALFFVADSQFEGAYRARAEAKKTARQQASSSEILRQPLNLDTLTAYLAIRLADRDEPDSGDASRLLQELSGVGVVDVATLDRELGAHEATALDQERKSPPSNIEYDEYGNEIEIGEDDGRYTATGFIRLAVIHKGQGIRRVNA